jgi:hypothetical protein
MYLGGMETAPTGGVEFLTFLVGRLREQAAADRMESKTTSIRRIRRNASTGCLGIHCLWTIDRG